MYLDLVIGEFRANVSISFGDMFSNIGKCFNRKRKPNTNADTSVIEQDISAESYEEDLISFYDVKAVNNIENKANEFASDLKRDSSGLYDIPSNKQTDLENYMSDVEIIDDSCEMEMQNKLYRVRGH